MRFLEGKKLVITGVINRESIAFEVARQAQAAGAEIVLTGFGRVKRMTDRSANRLDPVPDVLELDVNKPEDIEAVAEDLRERWGHVDGVLHVSGEPIPGAAVAVNRLREVGHRLRFVTNNTTSSRAALAEELRSMGIQLEDEELQTTPRAAAKALAGRWLPLFQN